MYRDNSYRDYEDSEFNMESDSEYEMENFQNEGEFNLQSEDEFETDPEFNMEADYESDDREADYENETNDEFESPQDELEAELEYVTNEQEFENWVNEIVVRDHRGKNLRPVLRSPLGRRAVKQISKIAFRTLPFIGRKRWGSTRSVNDGNRNRPHRRYRNRYWQNRQRYGPYSSSNSNNSYYQDQTSPDMGAYQQQQQQPAYQDGSFRNFVMDTIKNLSQQIAAGNDNIQALKSSISNSAANNYPAAQPEGAGDPPPPATGEPAPQSGEFEMEDYEDTEFDGEVFDSESTFDEVSEMELASELLSLNSESEVDHFLGGLFKKAVGGLKNILGSKEGGMLKGLLRKVLKKALPAAGAAAGTFFGGPLGTGVGANIGSAASNLFELELEGLSNEDREFEVAKAVVRLAGNAAKQLADNRTGNPSEDARHALVHAAQRYAPGLIMKKHRRFHNRPMGYTGMDNEPSFGGSGRWYRKGNKIIIDGAF